MKDGNGMTKTEAIYDAGFQEGWRKGVADERLRCAKICREHAGLKSHETRVACGNIHFLTIWLNLVQLMWFSIANTPLAEKCIKAMVKSILDDRKASHE